jgi:hypothetical protein
MDNLCWELRAMGLGDGTVRVTCITQMNNIKIKLDHDGYTISYLISPPLQYKPLSTVATWEQVLQECIRLGCLGSLSISVGYKKDIPDKFPDCKALTLGCTFDYASMPWIDGISRIPSLQMLITDRIRFDKLPPRVRLKKWRLSLTDPPYWLLDRLNQDGSDFYIVGRDMKWMTRLRLLRHVLTQGLCQQTRFNRWLTKGLHDPGVFSKIRDFLL